ncbi:MAG: hypothetical protein O3A02_05575, partial [bacterium]|nr:hypothetical protein [bacterium]
MRRRRRLLGGWGSVMVEKMLVRALAGQVDRCGVHDAERHLERDGHHPVRGRRGQSHDRRTHEPG